MQYTLLRITCFQLRERHRLFKFYSFIITSKLLQSQANAIKPNTKEYVVVRRTALTESSD